MSRRRFRRGRRPPPCASLSADDGIDPRRPLPDDLVEGPDRKTLRLCGQVARVLATAFSGLVRDETLAALRVVSVSPAPDATRLRVVVSAPSGSDPGAIAVRLVGAHAFLRAEVAEAIVRKRAPDLAFVIEVEGETP